MARTHYTRYYLHSDGSANTRSGDGTLSTAPPGAEPPDRYVYDPADPAPTLRGNTLMIPHGVADQRSTEDRGDVLVYTSDPLEHDLELTGPIKVQLFAASSAVDTDFTAKLVDVRPDGYAQNIQDGIIRARYRSSARQPSFITPGQVYEYTIDLWATSQVFKAGHRAAGRDFQQQLPPLRPQPEYRRSPGRGYPPGNGATDRSAPRRLSFPYRAAGNSALSSKTAGSIRQMGRAGTKTWSEQDQAPEV